MLSMTKRHWIDGSESYEHLPWYWDVAVPEV